MMAVPFFSSLFSSVWVGVVRFRSHAGRFRSVDKIRHGDIQGPMPVLTYQKAVLPRLPRQGVFAAAGYLP